MRAQVVHRMHKQDELFQVPRVLSFQIPYYKVTFPQQSVNKNPGPGIVLYVSLTKEHPPAQP